MRRLAASLGEIAAVTCTFGVVQALVGGLAVAVWFAGLILAPHDFFEIRYQDAYTKLFLHAGAALRLGFGQGAFIGPGLLAKLAILPSTLAVNLGVGLLLAPVLALLGPPLGLRDAEGRLRITRTLVVLVLFATVVHVLVWLTSVYVPDEPTTKVVVKNFLRNLAYDGTAFAIVVMIVSAVLARTVLAMLPPRHALLTTAIATALVAAIAAVSGTREGDASAQPAAAAGAPPAVAEGHNVVLISIDSLRADHVGAYGYERDTTPAIDDLARGGVRFANTSSVSSWTLPAHLTMLTGRSALGHGVLDDDHMLATDVPTLTETLHDAGYTTGAVVSAPYLHGRYGFSRGFDHYDDTTIEYETHGDSYKHVTAPLLQKTAAQWLEHNSDRRFFLFLHYWDPHYDYIPGPPYDTMFDPDYDGTMTGENFYFDGAVNREMDRRDLDHIVALYDGEIRLVDDHIAMLRETLADLGVADNTVVVVTADHGDEFFEHGRKGHRRSLYDEVLRVPLVLYVPGATPTKPVVSMEASLMDITPTLLAILGLEAPAGIEGIELAGVAYGDRAEWDRRTVAGLYRAESLNVQISWRNRTYKIIHHFNRRLMESFEIATDPGEQHALPNDSGLAPVLAAELVAWLNQAWPSFQQRIGRDDVNAVTMDEETKERLRALGYLQ